MGMLHLPKKTCSHSAHILVRYSRRKNHTCIFICRHNTYTYTHIQIHTIIHYILNYLKTIKLLKSIFPCYITTLLPVSSCPCWVFTRHPHVQITAGPCGCFHHGAYRASGASGAQRTCIPLGRWSSWWGVVVQPVGSFFPRVGNSNLKLGGGGKPSMHHVL